MWVVFFFELSHVDVLLRTGTLAEQETEERQVALLKELYALGLPDEQVRDITAASMGDPKDRKGFLELYNKLNKQGGLSLGDIAPSA